MPIILSAPHGGQKTLPGVPVRLGEGLPKGPSGFFTGRDINTDLLAHALAEAIEARMAAKPYYVIAQFSRKYIDANRKPEIAYEDPRAKPVYDYYHEALARACVAVKKANGRKSPMRWPSSPSATSRSRRRNDDSRGHGNHVPGARGRARRESRRQAHSPMMMKGAQ